VNLIFRLFYRIYRLYSGSRHRLVRRVTKAGLLVSGAAIVTALIGPDTDNNVAYQGFALLFSLLVVAFALNWPFRARFSLTRLAPSLGTVGCPVAYSLRVRNLTAKPQAGLTLLEELADPRPAFPDWLAVQLAEEREFRSFRVSTRGRTNPFVLATVKEAPLPEMPPGQEAEANLELTPLRRGLLRLEGVTLARPEPLGLFRALLRLPLPQTMLILPKRYPVPPLAMPGQMKYQQGGVALASHVGQSDEFVAVRDYRYGDPLRHIHWRSWARAGKPVVKEFEDEFFVRHALVLDTFTRQPHGDVFEEAVSVAASFACAIRTQESLLDLLFVGRQSFCFTAGRGLAHAQQMLEVLAAVQPCRAQPFDELQQLVLNHVQAVSGCVCVLLAWDEPRQALVRKLTTLGVPVSVLVVTEAGQSPPLDPGLLRSDPDKFHVLECGKIEEGLARLS
jgi:uncharacterized protein (DUF58 family)